MSVNEDRDTVEDDYGRVDRHEKRRGIAGTISGYFGQAKSADLAEQEAEVDYVPGGLLGELDVQQDEVIRRLDELNLKIERLMREWQPSSDDDDSAQSRSDTEAA